MSLIPPATLELLRIDGIDAHNAGKPRHANPYAYEASNAWDSGWMQAAQAQAETQAQPERPANWGEGLYISDEHDQIITAALRHYAAHTSSTDVAAEATALADSLYNDTWLLETATPPEDRVKPTTVRTRSPKVWSCGWNIPGYLCDDEPMNCDTWEQARDALVEALHQAVDDDSMNDEEHQLYLNAIDQLGREDPEFDWSMRIGNYMWWIQQIELPADRD